MSTSTSFLHVYWQRDIHLALLTVGQFDHAYQELMKLMDGTKIKLDIIKPIFGDAKLIEMEQAKLRVCAVLLYCVSVLLYCVSVL